MPVKQLTTKGVAALLSRSPHWVHMNAKRLGIPRYRLGGTWVYEETQVISWFESKKEVSEETPSKNRFKKQVIL